MREGGRGGREGEGRLVMNWKTAEVICVTDSFLLSCFASINSKTDKEIATTSLLFIKMLSLCC